MPSTPYVELGRSESLAAQHVVRNTKRPVLRTPRELLSDNPSVFVIGPAGSRLKLPSSGSEIRASPTWRIRGISPALTPRGDEAPAKDLEGEPVIAGSGWFQVPSTKALYNVGRRPLVDCGACEKQSFAASLNVKGCAMPALTHRRVITRRLSTRALPRVLVGRCGSIFENYSSVSQK